MSELQMIWDEVVSMLELELNNIQLRNWIMPLDPISLSDYRLILDAKSEFIRTMAQKKYLDSIQKCVSYICQGPVEVELIDPSQDDYYVIIDKYKIQDDGQVAMTGRTAESKIADKNHPSFTDVKFSPQGRDEQRPSWQWTSSSGEPSEKNYASSQQKRISQSESLVAKRLQEEKNLRDQQRANNGYRTLNPKYTMESFVRGKSNDFAYATAKAVVSNPGFVYNPLFIYGLSGLGKTHLMQAIAHEILNNDPSKKVLYLTSEKFMNEMIAMIENGTNQEKEKFRLKYRSIDVLLIDDIQFIAGKKATMEEIFHTFNDLKEANKQIVLSSDKPPKELKNLEERLVTRFEGGMTADIQKPDFETRVAILNHKMKGESISLPRYVLEFIANNITENIRELEGALLRVIAYFQFKAIDPINANKDEVMQIARDALKLEERRDLVITIEQIMTEVTSYYELEKNDLTSKSRQSSITLPRQIAMYLARNLTNLSLVSIGQSFDRDHTTVMHAIDKIESKLKNNDDLQDEINGLINLIKQA